MAVVRSKSCDEVSRRAEAPNPFWSSRTALEWEVRRARPGHLPEVRDRDLPPVPGSDVEEEGCEGEPGRRRSRSRPGGESQLNSRATIFETPVSWETAGCSEGERRGKGGNGPGLRTEGPMRMEEDENKTGNSADNAAEPARGESTTTRLDDLQRSLEEELVLKLHEENMKLKAEVRRLQELEEVHPTPSWSGGSPVARERDELPPPPPRRSDWDEIRYTPNGTQVPRGPPPREECEELWKKLPQWPLESYDHEQSQQPSWRKTWGSRCKDSQC